MKKPPPRARRTYYKPNGHKSTIVMLRVTPEEKAAWTAAAARVRQGWRRASLSDWLRLAAARALQAGALAATKTTTKKTTARRRSSGD